MSLNILIVEDSAVVRTMIARILTMAGLPLGKVHHAANGRDGLDVLGEHCVDLVFADINMPVMNGQEMITQIRANPAWADLPIIVVSTEGSKTRIHELCEQGVWFIHKPFSPETIRNVVMEILRDSHAQSTA